MDSDEKKMNTKVIIFLSEIALLLLYPKLHNHYTRIKHVEAIWEECEKPSSNAYNIIKKSLRWGKHQNFGNEHLLLQLPRNFR